jgi:hypothetical protein
MTKFEESHLATDLQCALCSDRKVLSGWIQKGEHDLLRQEGIFLPVNVVTSRIDKIYSAHLRHRDLLDRLKQCENKTYGPESTV